MKNTNKIISLVLIIVSMFCLCVPAFAESDVIENKEKFVLDQHSEDAAYEEKLWDGEADSYTDENGVKWRYLHKRNYIVSKNDSRYIYKELEDDTIAVCYDYTVEEPECEIIIPSKLDGKTVTKIEAFSFYCCFRVTGIQIPDTVKEVGYYAFASCTKLERIVIGNSVEIFNEEALRDCKDFVICFTGNEEQASDIVVWSKSKLTVVNNFDWSSFVSDKEKVTFGVNTKDLEPTTQNSFFGNNPFDFFTVIFASIISFFTAVFSNLF